MMEVNYPQIFQKIITHTHTYIHIEGANGEKDGQR